MISYISVVIPIYNLGKYLPRSFKSLLMQTIHNYEIILVDDGSTDDSGILCEKYAEKYAGFVRCIHKPNGGLASARNAGIDVARGNYVIFPDPDDWVEASYLEELWNLQIKNAADLVCTGYYIEFEKKSIPANTGLKYCVMSRDEAQKSLMVSPGMGGFAWNKLYHLDIIRQEKLYFLEDVGTTEDLDFTFRYLEYCTKICFSPECRTYHYYQHYAGATHGGFSLKKMDSIHTYEKILQASGENSQVGIIAKEEICNTAINLLVAYLSFDKKNPKDYQRLKEYIKKYYRNYIRSKRYGKGRKIQAVLARYVPALYWKAKKIITRKENGR